MVDGQTGQTGQTGQLEIAHSLVLKKELENVTILHCLVEEGTVMAQLLRLLNAMNTLAKMYNTQQIIVSNVYCKCQ